MGPVSCEPRTFETRTFCQFVRFRQGKCPGDRDRTIVAHDPGGGQKSATKPRQSIARGAAQEVVDQDESGRGVRGSLQETAGIGFIEVMQKK